MNFIEDEEVTEYTRKYPCLYDKSHKINKDKKAKRNAWKQIEGNLGMEEVSYITLFIGDFRPVSRFWTKSLGLTVWHKILMGYWHLSLDSSYFKSYLKRLFSFSEHNASFLKDWGCFVLEKEIIFIVNHSGWM